MDALLRLQAGLPSWAADLWRYANGLLLLALIFFPLERAFGAQRPDHPHPTRWSDEVAYYFLSGWLVPRVLAVALAGALWLLHGAVPNGVVPDLGALPPVPRFALALLVSELGLYWGHRAMHAVPWLWRFHAVHHAPRWLNWLTNTHAHPVDLVLTRLCGLLPLYVVGLAQPAQAEPDWVPLLVILVASFWGYFIHADLRWQLRWLAPLVSTPAFHHRHHAFLETGGSDGAGNYAALLPWVDKLFGTYLPATQGWPERYGVADPVPPTMVDQIMVPFMGSPPAGRTTDG